MKTQQRKFIVERKNERRRSTMQRSSIWGDTDLTALAREAEAEAPELFRPDMAPEAVTETSEQPSDPVPEALSAESSAAGGNAEIAAPPVEPVPTNEAVPTEEAVADDNNHQAAKPIRRQSPDRRTRRPRSGKSESAVRSRPAPVHAEAPLDDLAALEEENRLLKGMLARHLVQQNIELRAMLERFGAG